MPRYIDADAYIEKNECCGYLDEISVKKFNEITPTVDAVEVVRCKDCKDARRVRNGTYHCPCDNKDHIGGFYCAYGERREEITYDQ